MVVNETLTFDFDTNTHTHTKETTNDTIPLYLNIRRKIQMVTDKQRKKFLKFNYFRHNNACKYRIALFSKEIMANRAIDH